MISLQNFGTELLVKQVGIAMDYGMDGQGSIPSMGKIFLFSTSPRPVLESAQPPIQWIQRVSKAAGV
jgi:hypothetical protein